MSKCRALNGWVKTGVADNRRASGYTGRKGLPTPDVSRFLDKKSGTVRSLTAVSNGGRFAPTIVAKMHTLINSMPTLADFGVASRCVVAKPSVYTRLDTPQGVQFEKTE